MARNAWLVEFSDRLRITDADGNVLLERGVYGYPHINQGGKL